MKIINDVYKKEKGQVFILTLIVLALCSLIVGPLLNYMGTGLKAVNTYHQKTNQLYAADAGIQEALWKIKFDAQITADRNANTYLFYDYPNLQTVNNNNVSVTITANWLFGYLFRIVPGETPHQGAIITTCYPSGGLYTIEFYNPTQNPVAIQKMGIWLPAGFSYVGPCGPMTTVAPVTTPILGGTNIWWDFGTHAYNLAKGATITQQFSYDPDGEEPDGASSWVFPQQQAVGASWNDAVWFYDVTVTATDTSVSPNKTTTINAIITYDTTEETSGSIISYLIAQ